MDTKHSLLKRQLKRHFEGRFEVPPAWHGFIDAVNDAYLQFDSDRKMLERSLEFSSQELIQANSEMWAVFQAIPDLLFRLNHEGTILDFKAGTTGDLMLQAELLHGKRIQDIPLKHIGTQFERALTEVLKQKSAVSMEYELTLQGQERAYEARLVPMLEDQIIVIIRNITERKRAEALRAWQNTILEMIAKGLPLQDVLTSLVLLNEAQSPGMLCSVLLLDADEQRLRHGAAPSLPDDYNKAIDGVCIGPAVGSCGTAAFRKEPVFVTDILADTLWADYRELASQHGLRACWSVPIISHQGKVLGTFAMYYRETRAPGAAEMRLIENTTRIAGVAIERKKLEEQFRQAQKMEAFGQLAAGVAHDFNNILTVIMGNLSFLQMCEFTEEERAGAITEISNGAERAANLTRQLLTFGRRQLMQPQELDLNEVVGNMTKMLHRLIGEHITLGACFERGSAPVHADAGMIEQVLVNLTINSRDAMPKGGQLTIQTASVTLEQERTLPQKAPPGNYVQLTVRDTGSGIAPQHLHRIFEPFFTTKDVGKGTGLGLATVFSIVEQHHGWIEVESRLNAGTVFHIFLPRAKEGTNGHVKPVERRPGRKGHETILLVEDEEPVRRLMQGILERQGYQVYSASSEVAGLQVWEKRRAAIDLLVTDMVMPDGIGGRELANRMLSEKPGLKVIYCSGYTDDMLGKDSPLRKNTNFLEKPFNVEKLLTMVGDCLEKG